MLLYSEQAETFPEIFKIDGIISNHYNFVTIHTTRYTGLLIKMSLDILNMDMYATSDEDIEELSAQMMDYFTNILSKCHKNGIKACICGIEKAAQDELVQQAGFDYKQGYFYGKPEKIKK